jgi:antirestriction protein ArdC
MTLTDRWPLNDAYEDHAAYIASWLKVLQNDKRAIFQAAAHAEKAAAYLHGLQPKLEASPAVIEAAVPPMEEIGRG